MALNISTSAAISQALSLEYLGGAVNRGGALDWWSDHICQMTQVTRDGLVPHYHRLMEKLDLLALNGKLTLDTSIWVV